MTPEDTKRLLFINFAMGRIHEKVVSVYEELADNDIPKALSEIEELQEVLRGITEQISNEQN